MKISEMYNCQRIQLSNNKFINGILGGTLDLDCKTFWGNIFLQCYSVKKIGFSVIKQNI